MKYVERVLEQWEDSYLEKQWPDRVKGGMIKWASTRRWDVFWTQTYRKCSTVSGARAKWLHFLADFNSRWLPSTLGDVSLAESLWVTEPHGNWASNHVHALLSLSRPISLRTYESVWRIWKEAAWERLGKAFVMLTNPNAYVWYVLKYLTKDAKGIAWSGLPVWDHRKPSSASRSSRTATRPPPLAEKEWGIWLPNEQSAARLLEKEMDE